MAPARIKQVKAAKVQRGPGRPEGSRGSDEVANRGMILDAALQTFSVDGFEGASIATIAKAHQVSPALIHYYFKNKGELWHAAIEHGVGDMIRDLEAIMGDLDELDSVARLKFFIRRYIAMLAEKPAVFRVIVRESDTPGERLTWLADQYLKPLYSIFVRLVEAAQKDKRIKNTVSAPHLSQIIAGACYQFISSRNRMVATYGIDPLTREARDEHTRVVLDVLFQGMLVEK